MRIENFDSPLKLRQGAVRLSISNNHWESIQLLAWCQLQSDLIKGPVWFVKISQRVSPTRVAVLSAFVADGRR